MGVGGGIVADSDPSDEYRECLLKAAFLTRPRHDFQLIETMLWKKEFFLLSMHLERMESSADYFNFTFDRQAVLSRLHELSNSLAAGKSYRVRLLLRSDGNFTVENFELHDEPRTISVQLSPERTSSTDVFMRHKTTQREIYDRGYTEARAAGFYEVIFQNERGEITEGAISNIFIKKSGKLLTPPLSMRSTAGSISSLSAGNRSERRRKNRDRGRSENRRCSVSLQLRARPSRGEINLFRCLTITCSKAHT